MDHKAKILQPFSNGNPNTTFTPHHDTYHLEGEPYNQPKVDASQYRSKTTQKWTYNNPNKTGFYGTFTEFPKHVEEGEKPRPSITHENVWKYYFCYIDQTLTELQRATKKPKLCHPQFLVIWLLTKSEEESDCDPILITIFYLIKIDKLSGRLIINNNINR